MNIVEQAARLIDPEAFSESVWLDTATGKPHDFGDVERARREYMKSKALNAAAQVLTLACKTPTLREELIKIEAEGWRKLGIPAEILTDPDVKRIIAEKFS